MTRVQDLSVCRSRGSLREEGIAPTFDKPDLSDALLFYTRLPMMAAFLIRRSGYLLLFTGPSARLIAKRAVAHFSSR